MQVSGAPGSSISLTGTLAGVNGEKVPTTLSGQGTVGADGFATVTLTGQVTAPRLWSAEKPNLYYLVLDLAQDGKSVEKVEQRFGFRQVEIKNNIVLWNGKPIKTLTRPALTLLSALPWRGNAPELRSLLERLILLVPQGLIRLEDVLAHTQLEGSISPSGFDATLRQARARFERDYIAAVLQHQHGRIAEAARVLGIQRTNLYRKMRRLNLMRGKSGREA